MALTFPKGTTPSEYLNAYIVDSSKRTIGWVLYRLVDYGDATSRADADTRLGINRTADIEYGPEG